jgi:pyruvate dehydrogenase E1 component
VSTSSRHDPDCSVLEDIARRVLWLSVRIVDAANRERDTGDGVKVGGHQASSASVVSIMTALYFAHLRPADRVSVKPHASPVYHAIAYLLGHLDRGYLDRLRAYGGLQSYPSRTKDPDPVDFSTGSVGLGATAPVFAAATRRYVDAHFGARPRSRWVALIGDAELDEGNVWEALADPVTAGLGDVLWIVDLNRQSLDRVVPGLRIHSLRRQFEAVGWRVDEVKYGRRLTRAFAELPAGEALRDWLDAMPNEHYQSLFASTGEALRKRFLDGAPEAVGRSLAAVPDAELAGLITDLGGHDIAALLAALAAADEVRDRPTVIFAYTVKGWGLPIAGNPLNHSQLLTGDQVAELRSAAGLSPGDEWDRFAEDSPAGRLCRERAAVLDRVAAADRPAARVPAATQTRAPRRPVSTQEAFGRILADLGRDEAVGRLLVTTAPDVAVSTNLAGWINRVGVFAPQPVRDWSEGDLLLRWREHPEGQHIELGISEMNLFGLLGQLGLAAELSAQPLLPVGTLYDPFVCRGLDAFLYAVYSGSRFVVAGTPSGITLAPEGGAHQSTITASIGLELPGVSYCEPGYAAALDWLLCDALQGILDRRPGAACYLRLSTRPLDQAPFERARERLGEDALRAGVLAGGYRLWEAPGPGPGGPGGDPPVVHLAASGAVLPEALAAAAELAEEGIAARVVDVTSPDRLYRDWRGGVGGAVRTARRPAPPRLAGLFAPRAPIVTVHDAASHALAWLGSALGVPCVPLGVDGFGQSGSVPELYEAYDLSAGAVVNAALVALDLAGRL